MAAGPIQERNQDATIYVGGLDDKVNESIVWELFVQAGPVVTVHMPKDRITQTHQGYGFVEFMGEEDADYAIKVMNMIKLFGKPIRVNKASANQKNLDVGANLFIGNLDPELDEKLLYDTFSAFGVILQVPKIMRDPETGNSKGFAFVNFASFEAADSAIEAMNGQYLCNRPISVGYAFKKDSKGERHGTAAERLLAAQNPISQSERPHQLFADAPPVAQPAVSAAPAVSIPTPQMPGFAPPVSSGVSMPPPPPFMPPRSMAPVPGGVPPPPPVSSIHGGPPPPRMMPPTSQPGGMYGPPHGHMGGPTPAMHPPPRPPTMPGPPPPPPRGMHGHPGPGGGPSPMTRGPYPPPPPPPPGSRPHMPVPQGGQRPMHPPHGYGPPPGGPPHGGPPHGPHRPMMPPGPNMQPHPGYRPGFVPPPPRPPPLPPR